MARGFTRIGLVAVAVFATTAAAPGSAAAVDRFVDDGGVDSNPACPQANPCKTIVYALANSGTGDEIILDNGTYPESVTLGDGRSLSFSNFAPGDAIGPAIVDGGAGTAITVTGTGAGHIRDLTIRGDAGGVLMDGPAEVDGNSFDDPDAASGIALQANSGAAGSEIHDNAFSDPAPSASRSRSGVYAQVSAVDVVDNSFTGLNGGIQVTGGFSGVGLIEDNEITGIHNLPGAGSSILAGGVGTVIVRENSVSAAAGDGVIGISASTGSQLVRNEVTGHETGVRVLMNTTGVSLEGDRIWGNSFDGLSISDNDANPPQTSVTATSVTIVDNVGADIRNTASALTLDSSIVEDYFFSGSPSCTITFSRADTDPDTDPSGCDDFQATADPMFVNAATGNLHLQPGSSMLDMGNPADPPGGSVDFDGDARAVDATPACSGNVARRDVGADEFLPTPADCEPPDTAFTKTPPKKTKRKTVRFKFEADEPATFSCQLDDKPESACDSPAEVNVKPGRHKFLVTATDTASNVEVEPAKYRFRRTR